jgi:hypothetical protein
MVEEIKYSDSIPEKIAPKVADVETKELRDAAIYKIEKRQVEERTKAEMGIKELPKDIESVPKEIPNLFFMFGSKVLKCEKFRTNDEENKILAKHLSIIIGAQNSKIWSGIVILLIIVSKATDCMDALKNLFKKKDKLESDEETKRLEEVKKSGA